MHESDEVIYSRFLKERNENDLRTLLERHRESLILFLLGYVRNAEDAEELMMDAFAVAASGTAFFSGRSSFKTWLFAIGRNKARSFLRKKRGIFISLKEVPGVEAELQTTETPEEALIRDEEHRHLYEAMETLPDEYRQVLYLLYFEDMRTEEVCAVMKKNKKQIYNLTERGRKALKEALEQKGFPNTIRQQGA